MKERITGRQTRAQFEHLLTERASLQRSLDDATQAIILARAHGVERVTAETLTNEMSMRLRDRARAARDRDTERACQAWLQHGDHGARDLVIAALNKEAGL